MMGYRLSYREVEEIPSDMRWALKYELDRLRALRQLEMIDTLRISFATGDTTEAMLALCELAYADDPVRRAGMIEAVTRKA